MSIALERNNNSNPIQRSKFIQVYESSDTIAFTGDRRFPVAADREDSSSSSSIGRNSDSDFEDSNEMQSSYKGPFDTLNALEQVLPIKRGISCFYNGKSKSFTSLADISSASSIKEIAKPEDPYNRKRKNLLAHNNLFDKNHNYHFKSNGSGTSKKTANSGQSTMVLLRMTMTSSDINHSEDSNLIASSHSHHLPPLHPQGKRSPGDGSPPPPPRRNSPWRSFSLSDLQCVAGSSHNITGLAFHGGEVDSKQY